MEKCSGEHRGTGSSVLMLVDLALWEPVGQLSSSKSCTYMASLYGYPNTSL
jgi:hypothetical protein